MGVTLGARYPLPSPAAPSSGLALPGAAFVPYAGAVPDGGRHGFEAAETVEAPIV